MSETPPASAGKNHRVAPPAWNSNPSGKAGPQCRVRVPAEFEYHEAVAIGCAQMILHYPQVFVNLVRAIQGQVRILCLVNEVDEKLGRILLTAADIPVNTVEFIRLKSNSMWARDWCPVSGFDREGKRSFLGFQLNHLRTSAHLQVQPVLSEMFQSPVVNVPLNHEGGNFIANGEGLCVTSTTVLMKNLGQNVNGRVIAQIFNEYAGASQWAYLDPISGEATGHVDLFCTFVDVDKIVVGQFDSKADPVNAAELDRAAEILSQVKTSRGPLQVFRVPMPPPSDAHFRSYTNLLFANDVVVVPLFPHMDDELDRKALALFKELLPDRDVIGLDISDLSKLGGGLHCLTSNIVPATLDSVPRIPMPEPISEDQLPVESAGLTNA